MKERACWIWHRLSSTWPATKFPPPCRVARWSGEWRKGAAAPARITTRSSWIAWPAWDTSSRPAAASASNTATRLLASQSFQHGARFHGAFSAQGRFKIPQPRVCLIQVAPASGAPVGIRSRAVIQAGVEVHPHLDLGVGPCRQGRRLRRRGKVQYDRNLREIVNHHLAVHPQGAHDGCCQDHQCCHYVCRRRSARPLPLRFWLWLLLPL